MQSLFHQNESTAVGQAVACTAVTQRAQVRSLVGTSFLRWGFFSPVREMLEALGPQAPQISFGHHYHHQSSSLWAPMTWDVDMPWNFNIYTYHQNVNPNNVRRIQVVFIHPLSRNGSNNMRFIVNVASPPRSALKDISSRSFAPMCR